MKYVVVDFPKERLEKLVEETLYFGTKTIHVYQTLGPGEHGWVDCFQRITYRVNGVRTFTWYKLVLANAP